MCRYAWGWACAIRTSQLRIGGVRFEVASNEGAAKRWEGTTHEETIESGVCACERPCAGVSMKQYWLTIVSGLIGAFSVVLAVSVLLFNEDETSAGYAFLLSLLILIGVLMLAGLWWLRDGRLSETICLSLVGVGLVAFGVTWFWMLFIPTVVALIVLWFGIVKRGLVVELRPIPDA
jgi:hypothetical protein